MRASKINISVVIPVYNVQRYLKRCLDSIFSQQFAGSFEVIAVDDASRDASVQLLKEYRAKEPRLTIIEHGVNRKLSVARATGISAASGEYIMQVDPDDWLLPTAFAELYNTCSISNADVVAFNYLIEDGNGFQMAVNNISKYSLTSAKLEVQRHFLGAAWNKIVKRDIALDMIAGTVGVNMTEDLLYGIEILLRAKNVVLVPENYYVYCVNSESLTMRARDEIQPFSSLVIILDLINKIFESNSANMLFIERVLDYFEKSIHIQLANVRLLTVGNIDESMRFIEEISLNPIMTRIRIHRLRLSSSSSFLCLLELAIRSGYRLTFRILIKWIRIRIGYDGFRSLPR